MRLSSPEARATIARWARRAAAASICALALLLHDTADPTIPRAAQQETSLPAGPTARLELRYGSSSPPPSVRVELTAGGEIVARYEGALPVVLDAPRDRPVLLRVEAPGRARYLEPLVLEADRILRVPLPAGARITGRIIDERGEAISGAAVRIERENAEHPWITRTTEDGRFTVDTLVDGAHRVEVSARGHASAARDGVRPGGEPLELTLERVGLVAGRVVRPDGTGAAGATLIIAGSGLWPARQAQANAEGRFRLGDVPPGIYEVRAFAGDLVAEPRRGVEVEAGSPVFLTFALGEGVTLRGIVRDSVSGDPIAGAAVSIGGEALDVAPRAATTSAEGRFAVRGLTPGTRRVSVFAEGYVPVTAIEHEPGRPLEVELEPSAVLSGVVLDQNRRPLEGAAIEVVGDTEARQPIALGPEAGFRAAVFASHMTPSALAPAAALEVTSGPVPPIPLAPTELSLAPLPPSPEEVRASASFLSGESGHFRVSGVPPGRVQIIARLPGYAPGATGRLFVTAGSERDGIEIVLAPAGRLRGTVEDSRGDGVEGVLVEVRSDREPYPRVTFTDDRGGFELDDVFGELAVTAMPQGRPAVRGAATVGSGENAELSLVIEGELRSLSGRVTDEAGFPIPGAQLSVLSLRSDAPFRRTYFAADDGTFTLSELPGPPWRIEATDPGYAPARVDVAAETDRLRVILSPGGELSGSVLDDFTNEPVTARVRLTRVDLPPEVRETRSGSEGFRFTRVATGLWHLSIESEGLLSVEREVEVTARGVELDPIRLERAGWLEGTVVDALGEPMSRARVWLEGGASTRTDARGQFVLHGAPPEVVVVHAEHPAAGAAESAPQRVLAGRETLGVVIRLPERFDPDRAEALPGRRRGVALEVEGRRGQVRIREVIGGSHADRAGLRAGDVLERIDGERPESAGHAATLLRGASGVAAVLEIRRGDEQATVLVERESWTPP